MFERLDGLGLWLWLAAAQTTFWLALGLYLSQGFVSRPAPAHRLLCLAAGAALLTPLLGGLVQACGWGLLVGSERAVSFRLLPPEPPPPSRDLLSHAGRLWPYGLVIGWVTSSGWLLARLAGTLWRGRQCFGRGEPVDDPTLLTLLRQAMAAVGLARAPRLVRCPAALAPLVWCWSGRPQLVLPTTPLALRFDWGAVLRHELAHVRRRDAWAALLAELVVVVLWWHPLAWYVRRRLRLAAEFACDDWALASGASAADYVETLLELRSAPRRAGVVMAASDLATRSRRLLRRRRFVTPQVSRAGGLAAVILMVVLMVAVALLQARPGPAHGAAPLRAEAARISRAAR
jgi:hypothetical protein